LSRIINPDSAGKDRTRLSKSVVLAIRALARQREPGQESHDLAAFIALALAAISGTIEVSVAAWEKRGYWVKADRFRMEWAWAGQFAEKMNQALQQEDWATVALLAARIGEHLSKVNVAPGHRLGTPWEGAWEEFQRSSR
jgi:hypothetical protein